MAEKISAEKSTCLGPVDEYVIKSFLSLAFLRPPKAIFVPGIYFFGFSRYSNCERVKSTPFLLMTKGQLTSVSSFQVIPLLTFASV